jgi:hypothetical protein
MTMAKREKTKQQTIICKILHKKLILKQGEGWGEMRLPFI